MTTRSDRTVYLDNQATTQVDPRVLEEMLPALGGVYGNPASRSHRLGWEADALVETARERVADLIGAQPGEILFTSGATESDNLAIKGALPFLRERGCHVITVATEHRAVLDPCRQLQDEGLLELTTLGVDEQGMVSVDELRAALRDDTVLVSVMQANNEIGVVQPIAELAAATHEKGALFHCDAAQSVGRMAVDVAGLGADMVSVSAHKLYGPKGVGALYLRRSGRRVRLQAQVLGGGHERGLRSGTLNVPGIVGLGMACRLAGEEWQDEAQRVLGLRQRLASRLFAGLDQVQLNGHPEHRLPGNLNLSFACVEGESLMMGLPDVAVSSGSACSSASMEPSYVLRALGRSSEQAHSSIRFGVGRFNDESDIDFAADRVIAEVERLRKLSPLYRREEREVASG